jgi:KUP system potassium uptake protein
MSHGRRHDHRTAPMAALTLGAIGIVFGDIGTSPLYAMKETFSGHHDLAPSHDAVYGVLSLIFWSITIIVTVKYVSLIMRADNDGEGGIMALISLVQSAKLKGTRATIALVGLGAFGAALFYGDGMITPAISVLSAVEGLGVLEPDLDDFVVPITLAIVSVLFFVQRFGTAAVGRAFGPVMLLWFGSLAVFGVLEIVDEPEILGALSPHYGLQFLLERPGTAFLALGSIVLAVTGAEALYADMGHFGRSPIRRAWFAVVLPALVLNYMGQGALVLHDPKAVSSPFFELVPHALLLPMVILAACAAVIASQAVISGAFSVTRQAVGLGLLPLVTIRHTSEESAGQVYVPAVNWSLFVAIVVLVVGFGSSSALASAYGIAVTGTLAIDTILFFVVVRALWHRPLWLAIGGAAAFLIVDLTFFAANTTKIASGGWFPLAIGFAIFTVLITWRQGREIVSANRIAEEGDLRDFVVALEESDEPPVRVPGTAVFLNASSKTTPLAMRYNVVHNRVLHEQVIVASIEHLGTPYVDEGDRYEVDDLLIPDDGIVLVTLRFGFQERPDVPAVLERICEHDVPFDVSNATYFLSRIKIEPKANGGMAMWRKRMFTYISRNAASRAEYFGLPDERVVSLGGNIEL